ncbi:MAG: hypothetical protein IPJ19_08775 [Planctomycetes bacterium]|nr:hypothetical protein [Planctomycetota bacterium]
MSESPWSEEGTPAPKKKGLPAWAWWVGGGCLFLLLAGGIGTFLVVRFVGKAAKEWMDPEAQWATLKQVLPYDERPAGLEFQSSWHLFGTDGWVFRDTRGFVVLLMQFGGSNAAQTREVMLDPSATHGFMGKFGRHDQARVQLEVQGRTLSALRFVQDGAEGPGSESQGTGPGATILVDLTPEDGRPLILQMTRADRGSEAVDDQTVIDFLKPFHVGPQR